MANVGGPTQGCGQRDRQRPATWAPTVGTVSTCWAHWPAPPLRISPPMTITEDQAQESLELLHQVVAGVGEALGQ
ncbi:MAG: hypothetical protein Ct9H300mP1_10740 [Planctomycetaceae bacterium]|nr:MAG: hypothetical protein Ct9H300mP1_10740 [Planctomycetaceae bacterium]